MGGDVRGAEGDPCDAESPPERDFGWPKRTNPVHQQGASSSASSQLHSPNMGGFEGSPSRWHPQGQGPGGGGCSPPRLSPAPRQAGELRGAADRADMEAFSSPIQKAAAWQPGPSPRCSPPARPLRGGTPDPSPKRGTDLGNPPHAPWAVTSPCCRPHEARFQPQAAQAGECHRGSQEGHPLPCHDPSPAPPAHPICSPRPGAPHAPALGSQPELKPSSAPFDVPLPTPSQLPAKNAGDFSPLRRCRQVASCSCRPV